MKLSHILYKTDDLERGVISFRNKGFKVEYGSKNNPKNALIYFSEGPYIELIQRAPISPFIKVLLKIIGRGYLIDRFNEWDNSKEGFFEICLENYINNFRSEIKILSKYDQKFFITKSKRLDPFNRNLKWKLLFPSNIKIPFLMTYFNIDPKPKNFIHPNGIKKINEVHYGIEKKLMPLINELCDDQILKIEYGNKINVNYSYE